MLFYFDINILSTSGWQLLYSYIMYMGVWYLAYGICICIYALYIYIYIYVYIYILYVHYLCLYLYITVYLYSYVDVNEWYTYIYIYIHIILVYNIHQLAKDARISFDFTTLVECWWRSYVPKLWFGSAAFFAVIPVTLE